MSHPLLGGLRPARLVPAVAAIGSVVAAGVAFGRVFGFANVPAPLLLATLLGAISGLGARLVLVAGTSDVAGSGPLGSPPAPVSDEPGPAWLVDDPSTSAANPLLTARSAYRLAAAAVVVVGTLVASVLGDAVAATPSGAGDGISGLVGGWSRILTTSVPVPPSADRLPVFTGVVALGVALAAVAASRSRPGLDALLPAAVVLLVALALGVHGPGSVVAVSVAPAVLAAAYLLITSRPADVGVSWVPPGRSAAALVTGGVVVVVALSVGSAWPLATARTPVDLRSHLDPPVDLGQVANPLNVLPRLQGEEDTTVFRAQVDATWLASPTDWRLVSLDSYDGSGWTSSARATRAGTVLSAPAGVDASALGPSSTQRVTIAQLTGPWVPTTGVPTGVTPADLAFDPATSILVAGGDLTGRTFTLTSRIPSPTLDQLDSAGITVSSANAALTQVPSCVPPTLATMATKATAGVSRPDQEAAAVEQALATKGGFAVDAAATPGSSCGRLTSFLAAKQGTAEQFATAFVLMVRTLGLPSRLAVGFQPGSVDAATGTTVVHGSDATVWPEVELAHVGWVRFNPVPTATNTAQGGSGAATTTTTIDKASAGLNQVRGTVADSPNSTAPSGHNGPTPPAAARSSSGAWSPWYLIPLAVVAAGAGLLGVRLIARRRRRASRRDPSRAAPERITGAWAEVLDALAPLDASLTPREVTGAAARVAPDAETPVRTLGVLVDHSVYAGAGTDDDATRAWEMSDTAVSALRKAVPPGRRLRQLAVGAGRRR